MSIDIIQGDCVETLKTLCAASIQCVVTSPPYYGLRDYGVDGQIGLEETPEAYVDKLVRVFREVRRVLKDDGSLWLNLGDSYAGTIPGRGGKSDKQATNAGSFFDINRAKDRKTKRWGGGNVPATGALKPKDLIGIPWMVAFALRADGWYLRSDIIWNKRNPMPESVKDRPTKSHEYIFLLSKSAHYYYDAAAIAEERASSEKRADGICREASYGENSKQNKLHKRTYSGFNARWNKAPTNLRNKRDVWTLATKPYKGAHFATFPPGLIEPCVLAGSREGDTVLDPFSGSGTTGWVATKHHRNYIGCELNPDYIALAHKRLFGD